LASAGPNRWWAAAGALTFIVGAPTVAFAGAWTLPQGTGQLIETLYGWTGFGPPWGGNGSAGRFKVRYLNWLWVGLRAVLPNPLPNLVPDGASKSPALTRQAPCVERHPLAHIAPNASLRRGSPGVIAVAGLGLGAGYLGSLAHWSGPSGKALRKALRRAEVS
jgi:hypothetical protein